MISLRAFGGMSGERSRFIQDPDIAGFKLERTVPPCVPIRAVLGLEAETIDVGLGIEFDVAMVAIIIGLPLAIRPLPSSWSQS